MSSATDLVNETSPDEKKPFLSLTLKEKFSFIKNAITIEPVLCLYLVATAICVPAINILPFDMACQVNAKYNETICESIRAGTFEELGFKAEVDVVQQYVSDMQSWSTPVQNAVPIILLLFLGTYSDKHKIRKPFLLMPIFGEFFSATACMICALYINKLPVAYEGIAQSVLPSFFGGPSLLVMAAFSYIIDITTPDQRVVRIAALQIALNICIPIALTFSSLLFNATGYITSLLVGLCIYICAFLYGFFVVKESKQPSETTVRSSLIKDIFNPQHVIETLKLLTQSKGQQRLNIIFILVIIYITTTVTIGEDNIMFNFVQFAYGWTSPQYAYFQAAASAISFIGLAVGVPILSKVLKLQDLLIIIVAYSDKIISNVIFISVKKSCGLYIGLVAGVVAGISGAATRSQSSQYVSEDDMGKSQSLISIVEAIAAVVTIELYHQGLWRNFRDSYPQCVFLIGIALYVVGIIILILKFLKERRQPKHAETENGTEMETTKI